MGKSFALGWTGAPSREVEAGGHSKGYSLPCKSRGTTPWGDVRSHLAHGNKDTGVASVCLPGDVPYAGGSPEAAHTAPGCSAFTSLSSFCAVGSTWHVQVQAGTYPTRPSLILGVGEPRQTPQQGSQHCNQHRCCMSIHPRARDHFQDISNAVEQTSCPSHPFSFMPNLPHHPHGYIPGLFSASPFSICFQSAAPAASRCAVHHVSPPAAFESWHSPSAFCQAKPKKQILGFG